MKTGERLPRYKRNPGAIRDFDVTRRDEEIILIVARHRFIRSDQIANLLIAADPDDEQAERLATPATLVS